VGIDAYDVLIQTQEEQADHRIAQSDINIPMPPDLAAMRGQTLDYFLSDRGLRDSPLGRDLAEVRGVVVTKITSEIHARTSFAVTCLVLAVAGCALGMMFRSGNFLSAFAVGFVPAMMSIALIVTGQQVSGGGPSTLPVGLTFIWSPNILVLGAAVVMLARLQRQ
jgi:lipopolysaccharide export LptBFGC system permease protein LptF